MKILTKFFSQGEVKSNNGQAKQISKENKNKNLELIYDKKFDLNGILGDFDAKINFLYEKMSKMEKIIKTKDEEITQLKEILMRGHRPSMNQATSILNDSNIQKNRESVRYWFIYQQIFFLLVLQRKDL